MQFHKQLIQHCPTEDRYGDCFRTSLGCILDLRPEEVPHFFDKGKICDEAFDELHEWLSDRGLKIIDIPFNGKDIEPKQFIENINTWFSDILLLVSGESGGFKGVNHTVVALNGEFIHDPAIHNKFICGPCDDELYWVAFIVPKTIEFHYD